MRAITLRCFFVAIKPPLFLPQGIAKPAPTWAISNESSQSGGSRAEVTIGFQTAPRSEMLFGIQLIPLGLYQARRTIADGTHNF
jgi:hypothetical protein